MNLIKPEVLAPAGDRECVRAAVENGADAVYFGVGKFNARARAANFSAEDLPGLMAFLHGRGVKGFATFNTLVFQDELEAAERELRAIIRAGVDAAIVQDAGVCRLIRRLSPDFPIHASTQMSVTSEAGVAFAKELGAARVVLARECSIEEIAAVARGGTALPLEVFVHGALCVAFSGQCLTSEALGGRSANRGVCAQACRLPFELVCDGKTVPLDGRRYLLSPRDLAGVEMLPALMRAGVASLKIEGRLKSPEYVAAVTHVYRAAVDAVWKALASGGDAEAVARAARRDSAYALEMCFSRGLGTGWLQGVDNRTLVHARFGKKRGVFLGIVSGVDATSGRMRVTLEAPLKAGDGIVIDAGKPEEDEEGGFVQGVEGEWVRMGRECVAWQRVRAGMRLWKTADGTLSRRLRATFAEGAPRFARPISARVRGHCGEALQVEFDDGAGHVVMAESTVMLARAQKRALAPELLREQLGRLGGTAFSLGELECEGMDADVMLPVAELNRLRRSLVERLMASRSTPVRWTLEREKPAPPEALPPAQTLPAPEIIPGIHLLEQLDPALASGAGTVYCEFEDLRDFATAVARVRAFEQEAGVGVELWAAPPRMFKQGEDALLQRVRDCGADGFLVRNHEHFRAFPGARIRGDFPLNVANAPAAAFLRERYGLERLAVSYDLNAAQVEALLKAAPPAWFEITLHQHMPMFHMAHCLFCAFLSKGRDWRDCGRPCERHSVRLRDRTGIEHRVCSDAACRNTVFNGRAQTGAEFATRMAACGARHFRVEFLDEDKAAVAATLKHYKALLCGQTDGERIWRELRLLNQLGVTRGTLRVQGPNSCGMRRVEQ
ncbi:MAG: U32 family peptidase [Puniceicoccales bacterium]|nr:U32 family peptidase [Puniceicoccales bacterium]